VSSQPRKLSELEGVALGIIYNEQNATAYFVRCKLRAAPSSHWRASAGSVYPLLARLEGEGLVSSTADDDDGRGRKYLEITKKGRAALRSWIKAGVDPDLVSATADPARSRTFFLAALSKKDRVSYVENMLHAMEKYLDETRVHLAGISQKDDLFGYLGALGALTSTEARLEWLKHVQKRLC